MDNNRCNNNQEMIDGNTRSCCMGDDEEAFSLKDNKNDDTTTAKIITTASTSTTTHVNAPFDDTNRWTVGKLSLFILLAFSVIFHMVDGAQQMESFEAQDHYDALSADVIRPAFRYHSHLPALHHVVVDQRSSSSSSTNTGWFGSVYTVVEQVRDAFQVTIYSHDDND